MKKRRIIILIAILIFTLFLISCDNPTSNPPPPPTPTPPNEADFSFIVTGGLLEGTPAVQQDATAITISGPGGVSYSLATGDGTNDSDNPKFAFTGNRLMISGTVLSAGTYNVYIEVSNNYGAFNKPVEITVLEPPAAGSRIVYFDRNGGDTEANPIIMIVTPPSTSIDALPEPPVRNGLTFAGWNTAANGKGEVFTEDTTVGTNITLYAMWEPFHVPGATLAAKLQWLRSNSKSGSEYTLALNGEPENIGPQNLSYSGKSNITLYLRSDEGEKAISLSSNGPLFTIRSGVTLILENNITLIGRDNNNNSLVVIENSGSFVMKDGAMVIGNSCKTKIYPTWYNAGGVSVVGGGTFTMYGGEISNNYKDNYGGGSGGVSVYGKGTFIMNG